MPVMELNQASGISLRPSYTPKMAGEEDKDLMEQSSPRLPKVTQRSDPDILERQTTSESTGPSSQEPDVLEEVEDDGFETTFSGEDSH